jgi:glycosyltransferase involved in cell wall biosynthesis
MGAPQIAPRADAADARVNLLIVASSLWIGGAETVIRHLAEKIDRRRFNVTVCCLKHRGHIGDELARAGIEVLELLEPNGKQVDYLTFRKLLKVIRSRKIDVVHTHTTHGLVDAGLCRVLRPGLRVIHTFHFGNYPHEQPRIILMERIFSRMANRLVAVGEAQRAQLKSLFKFRDGAIGTIRNGVMLSSGSGDAAFRARVHAERRPIVGTIATYNEQKGLFDLVKVAKRVKERGVDAVFSVVGEGHLRPRLEAERRALGVEENVEFTGWVTNAATLALPQFDLFFQPSLWEAMSVVILEAMAAGKPIVATTVGENSRVLEHGVDGLLVQPGDIEGMADAICRVLQDDGLRGRLGDAARRKVTGQFTVDHMVRAYEQAYLDMLA